MDDIAVHCSWADAQLRQDQNEVSHLPPELRTLILDSTGSHYLDALAAAARLPQCTDQLFVLYTPLFVEFSARWTHHASTSLDDDRATLSSLARILPFAVCLKSDVADIISSDRLSTMLSSPVTSDAPHVKDKQLQDLLLALFRLLSFDRDYFEQFVHPVFLSSLLHHESLPVRFLAVECLCLIMHFADAFSLTLVETYLGNEPVLGSWEGSGIDYRLLKIWEERRWKGMGAEIAQTQTKRLQTGGQTPKQLDSVDLSERSALLGGVLLPRSTALLPSKGYFVATRTAVRNLHGLGNALLDEKPILLSGQAGSGKTSLVLEAARVLNKLSSMVTLYLNEQTDAKSLIGLYTSSTSGESFLWQPGVLTKALQEGRWVLIEDIDRAPAEVLGVLKPIIEEGDLFLTSRKERIRPANGFRLLATVRTSPGGSRSSTSRHAWLSNHRLWNTIRMDDYSRDEVSQLLTHRYPDIRSACHTILTVHEKISDLYRDNPSFKPAQGRLPSLRDLLKWSRRVNQRASSRGLQLSHQPVQEAFKIDTFKDAVDCYASHLYDEGLYLKVASSIAQEMNISPQQMEHVLSNGSEVVSRAKGVQIGRSPLHKVPSRRRQSRNTHFANTKCSQRTLESIAAGVEFGEPHLLVGETGVGKTSLIQHVAELVGQELTVVNLSQQSEATDLLGGLKPVTTRSILLPLVETFNTLFDDTFAATKNERFQIATSKAVAKQNWPRLLMLWQEAQQMAEKSLWTSVASPTANVANHSTKRRKLDTPKYEGLRDRWLNFSDSVNQVRAQVERGDKSHAFAFVEGRLVNAVRNGEWLLLDEINLAASDTLDHIVGLLHNGEDEKPSVLLTEAGAIERVTAHPNFRIFAAMNPATDAGKKDLAPALRSRFTELYVQAGDKNVDDLVKIVQAYLGDLLSSDKRAALDLARAYIGLNKLNEEHRLSDGAGDVPHFSIRSLVRCLLYVSEHCANHGLRRAMYEGFAMSFFTVLSRESESQALPIVTDHLLSNVKNINSFLTQQPKLPYDGTSYVAFRHHLVIRGPLAPDFQPNYIRTPSVERNLLNLARAASMRRFPILLQGPTSAGKTSMVEYLAKLSGNKFVRINNHEHTDLQEYLGSYASDTDGKLQYKEGVLVDALRQGHWIVLDELNLAPSDVLEALNRLLDDNRELLIPESQEVIRPHQNFMLFATQNPAGLYGGRKRLSRAFRNRFLELHFDDIPEDELEVILRERAQIAPSFCTQIVAVYKKLSLLRQSTRLFEHRNSFATLRDLFRWASRPVDDRQQLANHGFMLLAERVRDPAERIIVKQAIEETMKVIVNESVLYGLDLLPADIQDAQSVVWTSAMRRLYVLVSAALQNNEPVLLVGETGCGKTQICQVVAKAFGRQLNIYNAHSNTETGDLIGSQRPVRSRSELAKDVLANLHTLPKFDFDLDVVHVDDLIHRFNEMDTSSLDSDLVLKIRLSIGAYQSLFAWNDGSLVRAMKLGEHFLLDEISLADDSVLERLNSVLEPSRTILLAEKGSTDSFVVATPEFQFLATMNPGGDYGKRELSAALRNRLTEIWVPPLSKEDDILPILRGKLGAENTHLASTMLKFAVWFQATFSSSISPVIPLRDLLAWTAFVTSIKDLPVEVALVHGAALVYIDSLGANPAGMTTTVAFDVEESRRKCVKYLQTLVDVEVAAIYDETPRLHVTSGTVQVGPFRVTRSSNKPLSVPDLVFEAPTTLKNTMRILRALQMERAILLEGSPGVGKTAIIIALAHALGKQLTRINLSDQTDVMDLFGTDAPSESESFGRFSWKDGPLLQAMQSGGWVLLDEMNLASQSVLEGLNSCLDHRKEVYIAELDKSFSCHPDFFLFAAQNPHHQGGGRKGLPASFVNRFTVVYADPFHMEDLVHICRTKAPEISAEKLDPVLQAVFESDRVTSHSPTFFQGGPWELNLRDVNRWLSLCRNNPFLKPAYHFDTIVAQRFRNFHQKKQLQAVLSKISETGSFESLYSSLGPQVMQIGIAELQRDAHVQFMNSNVRQIPVKHFAQAKSIITAIANNWPVILTGSSGSGKSVLIRALAAASGSELVEISMNADIDTMDLLGGFEQFDPRRDLVKLKRNVGGLLVRYIQMAFLEKRTFQEVAPALIAQRICDDFGSNAIQLRQALLPIKPLIQGMDGLITELEAQDRSAREGRSRFAWNDGVLVEAIERGAWVVLDNANLSNSSVLDRLNSLLEPDGHLVMSEQHNAEGGIRIIKPHPKFRIFLTLDPRHGELSRAMRNRSLEVFLEADEVAPGQSTVVQYPFASKVNRLRNIFLEHLGETEIVPYLDSLSFDDVQLFGTQSELTPSSDPTFSSLNRIITERTLVDVKVWRHIHALWAKSVQSQLSVNLDQRIQPQLLLLNESLFAATDDAAVVRSLHSIATSWELVAAVSKVLVQLKRSAERVQALPRDQLTALDGSILTSRKGQIARNQIPPLFQFANTLCQAVSVFVQQSLQNSDSIQQMRYAMPVVQYIADLVQFFNVPIVDPAMFQAFLQIARDVKNGLDESAPTLASEYGSALQLLKATASRKSGKGLQCMWQAWKPRVPSNLAQLENKLALERLVVEFGALLQRLPQPRSELVVIKTKLLRACSSAREHEKGEEMVKSLEDAIKDLDLQSRRRIPVVGHLTGVFDLLYRRFVLSPHLPNSTDLELLSMFCSSDDALVINSFASDTDIQGSLRGLSMLRGCVDIGGDQLSRMLSTRLNQTEGQNLHSFDRVKEEIQQLAQVLCSNNSTIGMKTLKRIATKVEILFTGTLSCHWYCLTKEALSCVFANGRLDIARFASLEPSDIVISTIPDNEYFVEIYKSRLHPAVSRLASLADPDDVDKSCIIDARVAGEALVIISLAALILMVPDQSFDPALYPALSRERHDRRREETRSRIKAQQYFQAQVTGQNSSMFIRMLEEDLVVLADAPPAPSVARPITSQLHTVQEEFLNVLRGVVYSKADEILLRRDLDIGRLRIESRRLNDNITRIVERLGKLNRAYDDFVQPIIQLLGCLGLGAELISSTSEAEGDQLSAIQLANHIPLLGAHPRSVLDWAVRTVRLDSRPAFLWLQHEALTRWLTPPREADASGTRIFSFLQVIDGFYHEWTSRLSKDRAEAEMKSRYYAYRGDADGDEAAEETEIAEMFPDFESDAEVPQSTVTESSSRETAIKLAQLHSELFAAGESRSGLHNHLLQALNTMLKYSTEGQEFPPLIDLLPTILLQIDDKLKLLNEDSQKDINIYSDSNISESQKLVKLVQVIQNRFYEIGDRWPEHAVPGEVLSFCNQLLEFKLNDPLAKLLTKAEKLLEITSQWQSVASKEWTVAPLMEELTGLIISWRRLELSSWSRLLDLERQKHDEDAGSWYFIAYEAVIVNTLHAMDEMDSRSTYCKELARTLAEFLNAATLGQFLPRLKLLETLSMSLHEAVKSDSRLETMSACVSNVICHYQRYAAKVNQALLTGRAELEKGIVEQIKLASWKDTNITALRDSAKRSHYKLFKIVRKFRALLAKPVGPLRTADGSDVQPEAHLITNLSKNPQVGNNQLDSALATCKERLPDWLERPERLKSPIGATARMRQVYSKYQRNPFDAHLELADFRNDLKSAINSLQTETPSTLTDDNASLVRHLRERKRRLFAETIKAVVHMGIRRNLATSELGNQSSLAVVLAGSPDLPTSEASGSVEMANSSFHDLLDIMPQIRGSLTEHSQDLTEGEVRRCVGLLEGLLSVTIKQRAELTSAIKRLTDFQTHMSKLRSLVRDPDPQEIQLRHTAGEHVILPQISWLLGILDLACVILDIQSQRGSMANLVNLEGEIHGYAERLRELRRQFSAQPDLPIGLINRTTLAVQEHIWQLLKDLGASLEEWQTREPEIEFLVRQIIPWTERIADPPSPAFDDRSEISLREVDQSARMVADSVFVALQQLTAVENAVSSIEDSGWLMQTDKYVSQSMRTLHLPEVTKGLGSIFDKLADLQENDLTIGVSAIAIIAPILEQYGLICTHLQDQLMLTHLETCRLALLLAKSFTVLSTEGFCSPSVPSNGQEQAGKLESGTGLGEGEGAEDISKDIGDDEDLSELAQAEQTEKQDGEMEDVQDAVDMGADELQGDMGDAEEKNSDDDNDDEQSGDEGEEIDEETGSVDDLDPTAVDEKMWDDAQKEPENDKELKNDKAKGQRSDDQMAAEDGEKQGDSDVEGGLDETQEPNNDSDEEEVDGGGKAEAENADPHMQEEEALDLPEELQLTGEEEAKEDEIFNDGMDDLSDMDNPDGGDVTEEVDELADHDGEEDRPIDGKEDEDEANVEGDEEMPDGTAQDDQIMEDQPPEEDGNDEGFQTREDDAMHDLDNDGGGDKGAAIELQDNVDQDKTTEGQNQPEASAAERQPQSQSAAPDNEKHAEAGKGAIEQGIGRDNAIERQQTEALRKLADVLDQWHERREIFDPSKDQRSEQHDTDVNMAEADFEHVEGEEDGDAQALGSAAAEQAQNLDQSRAIQDGKMPADDEVALPDVQEQKEAEESVAERLNRLQAQAMGDRREDGSFIPRSDQTQTRVNQAEDMETESVTDDMASDVQQLDLDDRHPLSPLTSSSDAAQLWNHCSNATQQFSLLLTEQLRLILSPTTATKLRGDFRTGKRLNIKRIIPYIASGYKRDKIWMRRSVPSKRNYQIMIAVDDSQSMSESGADLLAFETLAMLCKSLSMLEVGEICVVGFGEEEQVRIAHPFGQPFGNESGVEIFKNFGFRQKGTDVKKLVQQSISIFQDARLKKTGSAADSDLWQLQLIVSDGHCSDHDSIRRLVRQAQEEKILIVFVIVDAGKGEGESIVDLKEASFEPDPDREGEMRVRTKRYLEGFPFPYYLVVRDVRDLPGVLATALKGWFGSVVDARN